jgi:3',5'-cyclic AMP phosphodiesterase CpdA
MDQREQAELVLSTVLPLFHTRGRSIAWGGLTSPGAGRADTPGSNQQEAASFSMDSFSLVQVSDSHLCAEHQFPTENWEVVAREINELGPDLIVHTGDTTVDGVGEPAQLDFAKEQIALLDAEVLVLPGNHDVGELPIHSNRLEPAVSAESCERFVNCFGQDRFIRDIVGWRLVGLNGLLPGSGIGIEEDLWDFLAGALDGADGKGVALFLHKPLYATQLGDGSHGHHYMGDDPAARLTDLLGQVDKVLVATGHLHEHRIQEVEGRRYVWSPSTSFVTDEIIRTPLGIPRVGFVHHEFSRGGVQSTIVCPEEMTTHLFLDHPDFYPGFQKAAQRFIDWKRSNPEG